MNTIKVICLVLVAFIPILTPAQNADKSLKKVGSVTIRTADDTPVALPKLGEKTLLIFYVDPDHAGQNQKFTDYLEEHEINSPNIHSFGIVNLKDAPLLPNGIVRAMIRKKIQKTGATMYTDPDHLLRDAWNLGDVNDKFTILIVNPQQEIAFIKKGAMSAEDIKEFNKVIDRYR